MWWIYQRIFSPQFLGFGFRGFGFCDIKRSHKRRLQNRCIIIGNNKNRMAFNLSFGFLFKNIRFSRLHWFSRLPLKNLIAVPKQKPRASFHWLSFFFFDRLHNPHRLTFTYHILTPTVGISLTFGELKSIFNYFDRAVLSVQNSFILHPNLHLR